MSCFNKLDRLLGIILGVALALLCGKSVRGQETPQASPRETAETKTKSEKSSSPGYLTLVIKLGPCSSCISIEKANQVPGRLIVRDVRSPFVYEITNNGKSVFVGSLPDDPFVVRGFSPPSKQGENISKSESATVLLYVPNADLNAAIEGKLGLKIYHAKAGSSLEHASVDELSQLKDKDKVSLEWQLSQSEFANQAKRAAK
jgi:hypothetical protein